MFARFLTVAFAIMMSNGSVMAQLPGQEGFALPNPVSFEELVALGLKIDEAHCPTRQCQGYEAAVDALIVSNNRPGYAGTVYIGPPPSWQSLYRQGNAELNAFLAKKRMLWPDMCLALVAIVQHTDQSGQFTGPAIPWGLDIARRITHPGLDCLGNLLAALPPSLNRANALWDAYGYCTVEAHARCSRLKPPPWFH